jgi:hypothetical protein
LGLEAIESLVTKLKPGAATMVAAAAAVAGFLFASGASSEKLKLSCCTNA